MHCKHLNSKDDYEDWSREAMLGVSEFTELVSNKDSLKPTTADIGGGAMFTDLWLWSNLCAASANLNQTSNPDSNEALWGTAHNGFTVSILVKTN